MAPLITETVSSNASKCRLAQESATTMIITSGNRMLGEPLIVTASNIPVSEGGTFAWMNCNTGTSNGPDSRLTASSLTLILTTARTSVNRIVKRRFPANADHTGCFQPN